MRFCLESPTDRGRDQVREQPREQNWANVECERNRWNVLDDAASTDGAQGFPALKSPEIVGTAVGKVRVAVNEEDRNVRRHSQEIPTIGTSSAGGELSQGLLVCLPVRHVRQLDAVQT